MSPLTANLPGKKMSVTLLLDLDNTLLDSDMTTFIPVYFQALSEAMKEYVSSEKLLRYLTQGTNAMMANRDSQKTLQEVFAENFYPYLGVERSILDPLVERFYRDIFPTLAYLTQKRPEAVDFVEWAFSAGHRIAIATNPLFPRAAIYHRLRWANLPPEKYPFELISSFETFHFSKPNPAYLAEVLQKIGWENDPVLVVGDDPVLDLSAAEELGLAAYWVAPAERTLPAERKTPLGRGEIGALRGWLEAADETALRPNLETQEKIAAMRPTPLA
jgi:HAD superfamily hydrolase (TIGR01549 family)